MILSRLRAAVALAVTVLLVVAPWRSLLHDGPFAWHVKQTSFVQGGLELLVLLAVTTLCFAAWRSTWARVACIGALAFYLRRHGVDVVVLASLLYGLGLLALGWLFLRLLGVAFHGLGTTLLAAAISGITALSLLLWGMSAAGFGSFAQLSLTSAVVLGLALLAARPLRLGQAAGRLLAGWRPDGVESFVLALGVVTVAFLFAKSTLVLDYDSLWYGLRTPTLLLGSGNVFTPPGLVAPVHYYPKLFELLVMVLSGRDSSALPFSASLWAGVALAGVCGLLARELGATRRGALLAGICMLTVPALACVMTMTKGDAFSALLVCSSIYFLVAFVSRPEQPALLALGVAALALGFGGRLSNLPYLGLMCLAYLGVAVRIPTAVGRVFTQRSALVALAALTVLALVTWRTIATAGIPWIGPGFLAKLAADAGFDHRWYVATNEFRDGRVHLPLLETLRTYLFTPANYLKPRRTWTGNAWFLLIFAGVLWGAYRRPGAGDSARPDRRVLLLWLLAACFPIILFSFQFRPGFGADGNYFLVPLACLTVASARFFDRAGGSSEARRPFLPLLLVLVLCVSQAGVTLLTSGWRAGTRAFDLRLDRTSFNFDARKSARLERAGLGDVDRFLQAQPPDTRVLTVGLGKDSYSFMLPVQAEPEEIIRWANPDLLASETNFRRFVAAAGIDFMVVARDDASALARYLRVVCGRNVPGARCSLAKRADNADVFRVTEAFR